MIGVSPDTQERNDRFRESLALPYPLVGDPNGMLARAYRARWPFGRRVRRTTYVIGPDRRIREAYRSELRVGAHAERACSVAARPARDPA